MKRPLRTSHDLAALAPGRTGDRRPRKGRNLLIGILGWAAAAAAGALVIFLPSATTFQHAQAEAQSKPKMQAFRRQVEKRLAECKKTNAALTARYKSLTAEQEKLLHQLQNLQARSTAIDQEIGGLEKDIAGLETAIQRAKDAARRNSGPAQALQEQLDSLKKTTTRLLASYKKHYEAAKAAYQAAVKDPDPFPLRRFLDHYANSPFAAAATFFCAEKTYKQREAENAGRLYTALIREFPDSAYVRYARCRLGQIKFHLDYRPWDKPVPFFPYKPFITEH